MDMADNERQADHESREQPEEGYTPALDDEERHEVERRMPPRAAVLHEAVGAIGEEELGRTAPALMWSGLAAGLSMGFSTVASAALRAHLPSLPFAELVTGLGYSTGFVIVIMARQQLFTENTLTVVLPLVAAPSWAKLARMLRLWGIVLVSNLVGVALFALAVAKLPLFPASLNQSIVALGDTLMGYTVAEMFVKAVAGGWIIATMVWLMPAAESARLWIIIGLTWLIAAAGLVHVIGSAGEVFYLVFAYRLPWAEVFWHYLGPVLAGNIVGGTLIFTLMSHAQVRSDAR
ncbi:MAG TPA: formate/nitrite transporter family protein [Rhodanobacteraceae bacterium]|nr:formate/nitrite transporter family protein [Rhodanobacteraceae bacterium]